MGRQSVGAGSAGENRALRQAGTAVDDDRFAGDVAGFVTGEEDHGAGDFLGAAEAPGGDEVGDAVLAEAGPQAGEAGGVDVAGFDALTVMLSAASSMAAVWMKPVTAALEVA